ncbi:MAG: dTDP-4-dehydrorhamnose reductase [Methanobacterium sp.]|nr:dTDP-4-dehydrorhamnose reductase [Methanobacterium sp.]
MLITGSKGMLAKDIIDELKKNNFQLYCMDREELDITKKEEFEKLNDIKLDLIINCAAYTNVDAAEENKELCYNINFIGVKNIADYCKLKNIILIHISTDYVFDGNKKSYDEEDVKKPLNYYGVTKALAEDYLIYNLDKFYIARTSWLFGKNGINFIEKMKKLMNEKKEIKVINDQFGRPTYTKDLSKTLVLLITQNKPFGVYNITNSGFCSWFEFASEIKSIINSECKIVECGSEEFLTKAIRPKNSILNNNKIEKLRNWKEAVKEYLSE